MDSENNLEKFLMISDIDPEALNLYWFYKFLIYFAKNGQKDPNINQWVSDYENIAPISFYKVAKMKVNIPNTEDVYLISSSQKKL